MLRSASSTPVKGCMCINCLFLELPLPRGERSGGRTCSVPTSRSALGASPLLRKAFLKLFFLIAAFFLSKGIHRGGTGSSYLSQKT